MPHRDIIVIGASAGGVEALSEVVRRLPGDLPAAVFVVLHIPPTGPSVLPSILNRVAKLDVTHARDGAPIRRGQVYVAPPDHHILIDPGVVRVVRGPRENGHRPAADPLFRSAARAYGPRVIGVVLSGALDDGTAGLQAIKSRGGLAVVQDPQTALFDGMPSSALENVSVDACLSLDQIGPRLAELASTAWLWEGVPPVSEEMEIETRLSELDFEVLQGTQRAGSPSGFGCPECGGALWEIREGEILRFRCRVGHAYSAESLLAGQVAAVEEALWAALRALEERAALSRRLRDRVSDRGQTGGAKRFDEQAVEAASHAAVIRRLLLRDHQPLVRPPTEGIDGPATDPGRYQTHSES